MTEDLIGRVFDGRYRIVAPLATGGMATVYRARQLNVDREVAIKVMHPEDRSERELAMRFESEAKIISELRHPNTLKLIDYGRSDELVYIVTELLVGRSLAQAIKEEAPFDPKRTLEIVRDVCLSLAEAHGRGIVHRDLKPANIFLERVGDQEVVKVLDFGIAKVTPAEAIEGRSPGATPKTVAGVLLGTPSHISPEMALGRSVDGRTDLYSLGVVAYQCLCGALPFEGAPITQIAAHGTDRPPRPSKKGSKPRLPPRVEALVMRLLEKDPNARAEGAAALAREIDDLLAEASALARKSSPLVFVAPIVAAAAAIGAYVMFEPGPEPPLTIPKKTEPAVDAVTTVRPRETGTGTVSSVAIVRDAGVRTGRRILGIDQVEGFVDETELRTALDATEAVLADCHEATQGDDTRVLTLWFRVSRTGNSLEVTPKDEPSERFRRCVALRMPNVKWPKRKGPGAVAVDVGDR